MITKFTTTALASLMFISPVLAAPSFYESAQNVLTQAFENTLSYCTTHPIITTAVVCVAYGTLVSRAREKQEEKIRLEKQEKEKTLHEQELLKHAAKSILSRNPEKLQIIQDILNRARNGEKISWEKWFEHAENSKLRQDEQIELFVKALENEPANKAKLEAEMQHYLDLCEECQTNRQLSQINRQ